MRWRVLAGGVVVLGVVGVLFFGGGRVMGESPVDVVVESWQVRDPDGHVAFAGWFQGLSGDGSRVLFDDPDGMWVSYVWDRDGAGGEGLSCRLCLLVRRC